MKGVARCFLGLLAIASAIAVEPSEIRIPLMAKSPVLDGEVKPEEWAAAARIEGLAGRSESERDSLALQEAAVWVGADRENLWLAAITATPPGGSLLSRVAPAPAGKNARVTLDDNLEISVAGPDGELHRLLINARGATAGFRGDGIWDAGAVVKNRVIGDLWHLEIKIPLARLGLTPEVLEKGVILGVARNWKRQKNALSRTDWSGRVTLEPKAPAAQVTRVLDRERRNLDMNIAFFNPHAHTVTVWLKAEATPERSAPTSLKQTIKLAAGERRDVPFRLPGAHDPAEAVRVALHAELDGGVLYQRDFTLRCDAVDDLWAVDEGAEKKVDFRFAYFPSYNKVKAAVDFSAIPQREKVSKIAFTVLDGGGKRISEAAADSLSGGAAELVWDVPPLADGEYTLRAELVGVDGFPPFEQKFVRHHFEWEGNSLGLSERVIAPFTPLTLEGDTVSAVLREHELSGEGLWKQVRAAGRGILAAPVRLEARGKDGALPVKAGGRKVLESAPASLRTAQDFHIGPLAARAVSRWEMDGVMFWELELPANPDTPVEELTLVVPLDARTATLMHVCTDGLRFNYAGVIPAGEGTVWRSTEAKRNKIANDYVPYIWLGDELRGVAVFGENDRGWITKEGRPLQEIVRDGERVELRLRLISGPATWNEPRTLKIGFQATPTKPMPEKWRTTFMARLPQDILKTYGDLIRPIIFLGSSSGYGTVLPAVDPTPRGGDFSIWDALAEARRTGKPNPAVIQKWTDESVGVYAKSSPPSELKYGMHVCSQRPKELLAYTNARGSLTSGPEGRTFLDEWLLAEFTPRQMAPLAGVHYDVDPGRSFQDWMLWLYSRMMDTFADHIYWDDVFLASNFDTPSSDAYRMENGKIQPSSGLVNMRNLVKRTAVLAEEKGRKPFNMVHMTNTAIAPILSFAQMIYSWEDRVGDMDFQDRWPRDYIRAESIGRQHGAVPIVINAIHSKDKSPLPEEKLAWVTRTAAGVMITHELRPNTTRPEYWEALRPLLAFGYGTDAAEVFNYWQEDYPAKITGGETSSILLKKPGAALLAVCDYGEGGEFSVKLDTKALGLEGGTLEVRDAATGESLPASDGIFLLKLKKHDYAIVQIGTQPAP